MKYLMSIPGIGWIVASQLLARIGDWRELKNIRQLAGFLGLVPTETPPVREPIADRLLVLEMDG